MKELTVDWRFWLFWGLAFLGFPIAGVLSNLLGPVDSPVKAIFAGVVAGAALGFVQWLVLRSAPVSIPIWWVVATSAGMAIGLSVSTLLFGSETGGNELLFRAALTGLCIGIAQWIVFRQVLPQSNVWIGVIAVGWTVGWFITRAFGVDLSFKWSLFGSSGAIVFQIITGLALYFLFRLSSGAK